MANAKEELATIQSRVGNIVKNAKAASRDLTDSEVATIETDAARATDLKAAIERGQKSAEFAASIGGGSDSVDLLGDSRVKGYLTPDAVKSTIRDASAQASKALVAGGSSTSAVSLDPEPQRLAIPGANLGLLGVVAVTRRDTPTYSYLKQTVRTNNAAVVAAGAQKPTSPVTVASVSNTLSVIATLSEYLPNYTLLDNSQLEDFVAAELAYFLNAKLTADAVATLNGTSGIQTQALSGTVAETLYLSASKVADLGYSPDTVILTRATLDALVLAKSTTGEYGIIPWDNGKLWGVLTPVVATGLTANTAMVLDSSRIGLSTDRQGLQIKKDDISRLDYNETRLLVESRWATDVYAAPAITKATLV